MKVEESGVGHDTFLRALWKEKELIEKQIKEMRKARKDNSVIGMIDRIEEEGLEEWDRKNQIYWKSIRLLKEKLERLEKVKDFGVYRLEYYKYQYR